MWAISNFMTLFCPKIQYYDMILYSNPAIQ